MPSRPRRGRSFVLVSAVVSAALLIVGGSALLSAQATPSTVVVPNANTSAEGNANNIAPFSCAAIGSTTSMRYQQVYSGAQVGAGSISQMAFRDAIFSSTVFPNVTIRLSTTPKAVTGLDTVFANNVGPDATTVFSGDLTLSGASFSGAPGPFDITIPFQTAFAFNPAAGNLLFDITIPTCENTGDFDFDSQLASSASTARNYAYSSTAAFGQGDGGQVFGGLVTQFTLGGGTAGGGCTVYRGITICPTTTTTGPPPRH